MWLRAEEKGGDRAAVIAVHLKLVGFGGCYLYQEEQYGS
jgi:hypothetical protein